MGAISSSPRFLRNPSINVNPQDKSFLGKRVDILDGEIPLQEFLRFLADSTGKPVIMENEAAASGLNSNIIVLTPIQNADDRVVRALLEESGWRLRETTLRDGRQVLVVAWRGETSGSPVLTLDLSDPRTRLVLLISLTSLAGLGLLVTVLSRRRRRRRSRGGAGPATSGSG